MHHTLGFVVRCTKKQVEFYVILAPLDPLERFLFCTAAHFF
jgi:hypothetical protein